MDNYPTDDSERIIDQVIAERDKLQAKVQQQAEQIERLENNIKAHINTDRVIFLEAENAKLKRIIDPHLDADGNFDRQGFDWKCLEWEDENNRLKEELQKIYGVLFSDGFTMGEKIVHCKNIVAAQPQKGPANERQNKD